MYVTRPLSMYKKNPDAMSLAPPPGPHSGYLVILDEEAETCYGFDLSKDSNIKSLPFPQNKDLTIKYSSDDDDAMFLPVLNQPLSSNRYYVIKRKGKYRGQAVTSSKEDDTETNSLCCISFINDVKPKPLDPSNDYQIVEIIKRGHGFHAKSITPDGIPPEFLRRKGWKVLHSPSTTSHNYHLEEALGSNDSLRAQLPDFKFPSSIYQSESVVVGKWYCPFMFVEEGGMRLAHQMKMSMFYKMTLKQRWEQIFLMGNRKGEDVVHVDVVIQTEIVKVGGRDVWDDENGVRDKKLWFRNSNEFSGAEISVGLSLEIVERMKWEQERVGWVARNERQVRVEREEKFGGTNKWKMFCCYLLVESFLLSRMDGKLGEG